MSFLQVGRRLGSDRWCLNRHPKGCVSRAPKVRFQGMSDGTHRLSVGFCSWSKNPLIRILRHALEVPFQHRFRNRFRKEPPRRAGGSGVEKQGSSSAKGDNKVCPAPLIARGNREFKFKEAQKQRYFAEDTRVHIFQASFGSLWTRWTAECLCRGEIK